MTEAFIRTSDSFRFSADALNQSRPLPILIFPAFLIQDCPISELLPFLQPVFDGMQIGLRSRQVLPDSLILVSTDQKFRGFGLHGSFLLHLYN